MRLQSLNIGHTRDVRDEIRMTAFAFAYLNAAAAQNYLSELNQDDVAYGDTQDILRAPGTLARAAPAALVDFMLGALIEKETPMPCMQTGALDMDRLVYMIISSRRHRRAKVPSWIYWKARPPKACVSSGKSLSTRRNGVASNISRHMKAFRASQSRFPAARSHSMGIGLSIIGYAASRPRWPRRQP